MNENKFGKYIKYATGEIILVVIGILIALSINNWNESRKSINIEKYYLNSIYQDLRHDTSNIYRRLQEIDRTITIIDSLIVDASQTEDNILTHLLPNLYMSTFNLEIESSTIDDLKSTGHLNLIRNNKLRELILVYYKEIDSSEKGINSSLLTYSRETIGPYLMKNYNIVFNDMVISDKIDIQYKLTNNKLKNDIFLVNALGYRKSILTGLGIAYNGILENATDVINIIENEIIE